MLFIICFQLIPDSTDYQLYCLSDWNDVYFVIVNEYFFPTVNYASFQEHSMIHVYSGIRFFELYLIFFLG